MLGFWIFLSVVVVVDAYCYVNGADGSLFFGDKTYGEYYMRCRKQYGDDAHWPEFAWSKLDRLKVKSEAKEAKAAKKANR